MEISIINLITLLVINAYAPNRDDPDWFNALFDIIQPISNNCEIWTGDWNAALSNNDIYNYPQLRNLLASQTINNFMNKTGLLDIWRIQNPERKRFRWRLTKPCRTSRLDYFLISEDILSLNPKADILNSYKSMYVCTLLTIT